LLDGCEGRDVRLLLRRTAERKDHTSGDASFRKPAPQGRSDDERSDPDKRSDDRTDVRRGSSTTGRRGAVGTCCVLERNVRPQLRRRLGRVAGAHP
jgi:hypothetical protein